MTDRCHWKRDNLNRKVRIFDCEGGISVLLLEPQLPCMCQTVFHISAQPSHHPGLCVCVAVCSHFILCCSFYDGVEFDFQVLKGDLIPAIEIHETLYRVIQQHKFIPEVG